MDIPTQTPEHGKRDIERVVFDQLLERVIRFGTIDPEYDAPDNREQYPRNNRQGQAAHSFELKKSLDTKRGFDASSMVAFYVQEYVDEADIGHEGNQVHITLKYDVGYEKVIWLSLEADGSIVSQVRLDAYAMEDEPEPDYLNDGKEALLEAIQSKDDNALEALIISDERLRDSYIRLLAKLSSFDTAPLSIYDLEELREVVRQLDDSL